jgi:hypothetical protein
VRVDEDQASGNGIAPSTQNGAAFTTTHWSVVLAARGPSPAAEEALEKLCRDAILDRFEFRESL